MIFDEIFDEDKDMTCLIRRYKNWERKHRDLREAENSNRAVNGNHLCHKYGKPGHFMKDCPMHKVETKEYPRPGGEKVRRRDLVPKRKARKVVADYEVKKALAAWDTLQVSQMN